MLINWAYVGAMLLKWAPKRLNIKQRDRDGIQQNRIYWHTFPFLWQARRFLNGP